MNFGQFFLGISDEKEEGKWVYDSDGTEVDFTNWKNNRPDNANGNQHYIIVQGATAGTWEDTHAQGMVILILISLMLVKTFFAAVYGIR